MTTYIARVQLGGVPSAEQYQDLHDGLLHLGWLRQILGDNGGWHQLPHGTYAKVSLGTDVNSMRDEVQAVANQIKTYPTPQTIVVRYDNASWSLNPVQ